MKRLLLFVHYNKNDELDDRVVHTLKRIRTLYSTVVVISNSRLSDQNISILNKYADDVTQRANSGYDFSAWKQALHEIGWSKLKKYDNVTLMNDTCHFPIWPMEKYYKKFDKFDFWGASIHTATEIGMPGTNGPVPEHIQSYFMSFNRRVIGSKVFHNFWRDVKAHTDVKRVIRLYETQLTRILSDEGFSYDAIIGRTDAVFKNTDVVNPAFQVPDVLLSQKFPFIKIKAINKANYTKLFNMLNKTAYPQKYLQRPNLLLLYKVLSAVKRLVTRDTHLLFLLIGAPSVITFAILTPLGFGGDEAVHTYRAYSISRGKPFSYTEMVPTNLRDMASFGWTTASEAPWGASFYSRSDIRGEKSYIINGLGDKKFRSPVGKVNYDSTGMYSPIMYAGAALGIAIGSLTDLTILATVILARVLNAIPFFVLGSLSLYILRKKTYRWIIFTILLAPTVVSYVGTINGDPFNIAAIAFFISVFLKAVDCKGRLSNKLVLALFGASLLLSVSKLPTILLIGLLPFIGSRKFKNKKDFVIKIGGTITTAALLSLAIMKAGVGHAANSSLTEKVSWLIHAPTDGLKLLMRTVIIESPDYVNRMVGVIGSNGVYIHGILIIGLLVWLAVLTLATNERNRKLGGLLMMSALVIWGAIVCLLFLGDANNTPSSLTVWGVHGKYFTPFLPIFLIGMGLLSPLKLTYRQQTLALMAVTFSTFLVVSSIYTFYLALY